MAEKRMDLKSRPCGSFQFFFQKSGKDCRSVEKHRKGLIQSILGKQILWDCWHEIAANFSINEKF